MGSSSTLKRCAWVSEDPLYIDYHDQEWGVPVYDDFKLFEFLILETFQAGLSWITILKKRENFRKAFAGFDYQKVARFLDKDIQRLLEDVGIIRNKLKIHAAVNNAKSFIDVQNEFESFSNYMWAFVNNSPVVNSWEKESEVPATTKLAKELSKDMKKRGFKFVGPTVMYAHLQAVGVVNDHIKSCFRYNQCK